MKTDSDYISPRLGGLGPKLAWKIRSKIFTNLMRTLQPTSNWKVLDAGVTSDRTPDSNFFERLYPYKSMIVAVGLEDASFLEQEYPGVTFYRANACNLPFDDKTFDLAFCSAVIEHVGQRQNQLTLLRELTRVSRIAVVTTPNRYFPIEFHTLTPFLHWLPPSIFRSFLKLTGRNFFADEQNLNLLSERDLNKLIQEAGLFPKTQHEHLLGIKSNLVYYISRDEEIGRM